MGSSQIAVFPSRENPSREVLKLAEQIEEDGGVPLAGPT